MEPVENKKKMGVISKIFIFLVIIVILIYSWMHFIEPKFLVVKDFVISNKKIPSSFEGFTIVLFSDIHFGRTTNEKEVNKVVDKINECKPDLVLFSGDLFDSYINLSNDNINFLKEALSKIQANIKKYAIKGDQDYLNEEAFTDIINSSGFELLDGKNKPIYFKSNTPIYISGVSSVTKNTPNYTEAFKKENDGFQLFLSHEPIVIEDIKNQTDVLFSGHTLGGLLRLPFIGGLIKKDNSSSFEKGKYQDGKTLIFVSSGIGTETYSLRLFNLPSIYCYRLTP